MTFEEYWNNLPDFYRSPFDNVKAAAEKAFNEVTKIERERCAPSQPPYRAAKGK